MFSFPDGLEEIPRAQAAALDGSLHLGSPVHRIRRTVGGWEIAAGPVGALRIESFSAVICAVPADALSQLSFEGVPGAEGLRDYEHVYQPPVVSIFTGFRREDVGHPLLGFGLLVPALEKSRILGTLFSSSLFPGRAPRGHVALTSFVGGARQPELANAGDDELLNLATGELAGLIGVRSRPRYGRVQRWPRAIPQYNLGFGRHLEACARVERSAAGIFIGGNCRDGISLPNCIESGTRLAAAALAYGESGHQI
jgi:oxygen-dependent protoporphyrinogen oxidase